MLKKPWILIIGWMVLLAASAGAATETAVPPLKAYLQALLSTAKSFDGAASAIFLSPGRDPDEKPTLAASLDEIIRYLGDSEPFSLQKAQRLPQAFTLGGTTNNRRGGMVAWHNDLFAADFFVRRIGDWQKSGAGNVGRLFADLFQQPWFQWNAGGFSYHTGGAGDRIFTLMRAAAGEGKVLRLFRGTTNFESRILELGRKLEWREPLDPKWREGLKASLKEIADHAEKFYRAYEKGLSEKWATPADVASKRQKWEAVVKRNDELIRGAESAKDETAIRNYVRGCLAGLLSQGEFCGLFTTPDSERAKLFSKGQVVEFAFDWEALAALMKHDRLYVGFEKMFGNSVEKVQIEVGFLGAASDPSTPGGLVDIVMRSYRRSTPEKSSELFN